MPCQSRWAHGRRRFVPNPRVKTQRCCSNTPCQRARKAKWQRDKMATDPDYQANQRDARQAWQSRHRGDWRHYRQRRADDRERNRLLQTHRDQSRRLRPRAKMDPSGGVSFVNPGRYHLIPATGEHRAKMDALSMKCRLVPIP